ncbi:MAG: crossover junction endodeoxyribonuclease RuvC, partial [Verrucomicrobiales bacterium]
MRVLAIDPALRNTGFAVLECGGPSGNEFRTLTYGVIENKKKLLPSACLVAIRDNLNQVIQAHSPDVCAIESVIYVQSYRTAITLGAARGAAIIAAAEHGLSVHEYPPKRVKQAVVGKGGA